MKETNFDLHRLTLQNSKGIPSIKQYLRKVREDSGPNQIIIEVERANAGGYQPHTIFWRIWVSSLRLKFPSLRKLMEEASNTQISNFEDYFANFAKNVKHLIYEHRYNVLSVLPVHIYDHFEVKYHLKEVPIEPFSILPKISSTEYQETVPVEPLLKGKSNETKDYPGKAATAAI